MTLFYKIMNNLTPLYTMEPIPPPNQLQFSRRNQNIIGPIRARREKILSNFCPNCVSQCDWNQLDPEARITPSIAAFKSKLLSIIRPPARHVVGFMTH